jgi:hypothetical protein
MTMQRQYIFLGGRNSFVPPRRGLGAEMDRVAFADVPIVLN